MYTSESPATSHTLHSFLGQIEIPVLGESAKQELNSPIVISELSEAIHSIKGGKAPDSIPIEIYKKFEDMLLIPLLNMCEESLENEDERTYNLNIKAR